MRTRAELEAAIYDGLVSFNATAGWNILRLAQHRQYLAEHLAAALHVEEKASATAPTATPRRDDDRARLNVLRRGVIEWTGVWTTRRAQHLYASVFGPGDWRRTARRDLAQLHAEGLLVEHAEEPTRHHYTFNSRKGGHS